MTFSLDIRAPVFVLAADCNPAIFQLPWIAKNLHGKQEGEELPIAELSIETADGIVAQLSFLDGIALNVQFGRTEIFVLDAYPETLERAENILAKLIIVLPHTPLKAIGCNLGFSDDNPTAAITSLFDTLEGIEAEYPVNARQVSTQLVLDDNCVLNFNRAMTANSVRYAFNYHRAETEVASYLEFIPGIIEKRLTHAKSFLQSLYGYESHETIGFMPTEMQRENPNDQAIDADPVN